MHRKHRKRMIAAILPGVLCALSLTALEAQGNEALVNARQKFFGIENVDANGNVKGDKVIVSWASNTTYVVSIMGRVVMLDSFIRQVQLPTTPVDRRYSKMLPQDFVDLKPEAIFLGHGHGDHADNAAFIAKWTDASIYASPETCDVMQLDVIRMWNDPNVVNGGTRIIPNGAPVNCVGVVPRGSRPGEYDETTNRSRARRIDALDPQVCILAFKFIHSGTAPLDTRFQHFNFTPRGDPRYDGVTIGSTDYPAIFPPGTSFTPPANPANAVPGQMDTTTTGFGSPPGNPAGAITIAYQFVLRGPKRNNYFSFVWLNSAGPATEGIGSDPGLVTLAQYNDPNFAPASKALARNIGASLFALMDTLPATDVLFGSILSVGGLVNQQRDIITVTQHLKPKVYYPGHFGGPAPNGIPGDNLYHHISWHETAVNMGWPKSQWPEFKPFMDPVHYMMPQVFDPTDDRWAKGKGNVVPKLCRG
jgi:glyoxylase-like metal-dependent hydrolase (beta-lactamase superfamily II)